MEILFELLLLFTIIILSLIGILHNVKSKPQNTLEKILYLGIVPLKLIFIGIFILSCIEIFKLLSI